MSNIISDVTRLPSGRFEVTMSDGRKTNLSFSALMIEIGVLTLEQSRMAFSAQFDAADDLLKAMQELNDIMQQLNTLKSQFKHDDDTDTEIKDPTLKELDKITNPPTLNTKSSDGEFDFSNYEDEEKFSLALFNYLSHKNMFRLPGDESSQLSSEEKKALIEKYMDEYKSYATKRDKYESDKEKYKDENFYRTEETTDDNGVKTLNVWPIDHSNSAYTKLVQFNKKYPSLNINIGDLSNNGTYTKKSIEAAISNVQAQQSNISSLTEQQNMRTNQANSRVTGWLQQLQSLLQTLKEALQAAGKTGGM